jgi:hypothetical protein
MSTKRPTRRALKTAVAAAAAVGAVAAGTLVAQAAIPSSSTGRITGCTSSGAPLRLIDTDAGQTCNAGETKVSWGGGMRFRGVWKADATTATIPYSQADPVQKGDVIRYDGPVNKYGCTTPKGSWVNVAGAHAYPCLEYPQNWAPLALDGAQGAAGSNADAHWIRIDGAGKLLASSDNGAWTYPSYPYTWIWLPGVADASKCSVTATVTKTAPVFATAEPYAGTGYVLLAAFSMATGQAVPGYPIDATMTCGHYA